MNYRDLLVWNRAVDLAVEICHATESLPLEERYGLRAQTRGAAVSVPSNVAEGEGRGTPGDHLRFLGHARGSLYELDTQIEICDRLGYLKRASLSAAIEDVAKLINGSIRHVQGLRDRQSANPRIS